MYTASLNVADVWICFLNLEAFVQKMFCIHTCPRKMLFAYLTPIMKCTKHILSCLSFYGRVYVVYIGRYVYIHVAQSSFLPFPRKTLLFRFVASSFSSSWVHFPGGEDPSRLDRVAANLFSKSVLDSR